MKPHRVIMRHNGEPYLHRWHVIPRNPYCNIYLHHFLGSDDERALHDHPWGSVSFLLKGELWEVFHEVGRQWTRRIPWLWPVHRSPTFAHRMVLPEGQTAWTLFVTGPRVRPWGFYCAQGWRHWREYDAKGGCDAGT